MLAGNEITGSQRDCAISIEELKNEELIQSFGVCVLEFHWFCINSWYLSGLPLPQGIVNSYQLESRYGAGLYKIDWEEK